MALAAPDSPLPAPRGTIGTFASAQAFTTACTCSVFSGSTTASGVPDGASGIMSREYDAVTSESVSTALLPSRSRSRVTKASSLMTSW